MQGGCGEKTTFYPSALLEDNGNMTYTMSKTKDLNIPPCQLCHQTTSQPSVSRLRAVIGVVGLNIASTQPSSSSSAST